MQNLKILRIRESNPQRKNRNTPETIAIVTSFDRTLLTKTSEQFLQVAIKTGHIYNPKLSIDASIKLRYVLMHI